MDKRTAPSSQAPRHRPMEDGTLGLGLGLADPAGPGISLPSAMHGAVARAIPAGATGIAAPLAWQPAGAQAARARLHTNLPGNLAGLHGAGAALGLTTLAAAAPPITGVSMVTTQVTADSLAVPDAAPVFAGPLLGGLSTPARYSALALRRDVAALGDRLPTALPTALLWGGPAREGAAPAGAVGTGTADGRATSGTMPSAPQLADFTLSNPVAFTTLPNLSYSLPSAFYQSFGKSISYGAGGFNAYANLSLAGGIKGKVSLGFGDVLPNYPIMLNAETVGSVKDNEPFTVTPTLISTDDASYSLSLPTVAASASYGLKLAGGVGLSFPSFGFSLGLFSVSFTPPSLYDSLVSVGSIQSLATSKTENFPGGYATLSELTGGTFNAPQVYSKYGLPTLSATGYTAPFLQAQFDPLAALSQYVPELKVLDGSENFDVGSLNFSLLSLPISTSLEIANKLSLTPTGLNVGLMESVGGSTTNLGTYAVTVGTTAGHQWTLESPSTGAGVIDLTLDYALTLNVQSAISLFGSFGISLDGPQASLDLFGHSFGLSPLFQLSLVNVSGNIFTYDLPSTTETLTAVQHQQIFYGPIAVPQTLSSSLAMSYELKAGGEILTIASGVTIQPATNTVAPTIGIQGTLGAAAIYNNGVILPNSLGHQGVQPPAIGIDLSAGGKIVNAGYISSQGLRYGIEIGGNASTVINSGNIRGAWYAGIYAAGKTGTTTYIYNTKSGFLQNDADGILSNGALIEVHNQGTILGFANGSHPTTANNGILSSGGMFVYNAASGDIATFNGPGGAGLPFDHSGAVYGRGDNFSYLGNKGTIGLYTKPSVNETLTSWYGVDLSQGEIDNSGTIVGYSTGVVLGRYNNTTESLATAFLENSGTIEQTATANFGSFPDGASVALLGKDSGLAIAPGAVFEHAGGLVNVYAKFAYQATNYIDLLAGSKTGTLNMTNGNNYLHFGQITVANSAAWLLDTTTTEDFGGATITGLTKLDRIGFQGLGFAYGDHAALNTVNGTLSLLSSGGSTLATVNLGGKQAAENFHVFGHEGNTYIREFTGNFTNTITAATASQAINASSYYGGRVTLTADATVSYNVVGAPATSFGIDLQKVTTTNTATIGGKVTVTSTTLPQYLSNFGTIIGNGQGIYLQAPGNIYNKAGGLITAKGVGVAQQAGFAAAFIGNSGTIYGGTAAISLPAAGTIVNKAGGLLHGGQNGAMLGGTGFLYNAGSIAGTTGSGVMLANGAVTNAIGGVITGATGVTASGTLVNITNSGAISGGVGISLLQGGGITNSYGLSGGKPVFGTITGSTYGVVVKGGAGTIINEANTIANGGSFGVITGISLGAGGMIANGVNGSITHGGGNYAIALAKGSSATVLNSGTIGLILAAGSDRLTNSASGALQAVVGAAGGSLTLANQGQIGTYGSGTAVSGAGASTITNQGGIKGASGIVLSGVGTVINAAGGFIEAGGAGVSSSSAGISLLAGGMIYNAGEIAGIGCDAVYLNGGTLINAGALSGAIAFGANAATLIWQAGASFRGQINGNIAANDTFVLGGAVASTLAGFGQTSGLFTINSFQTTEELAGSNWTLTGANTLAGSWSIAGTLVGDVVSSVTPATALRVTGSIDITGHVSGASAYHRTTAGKYAGVAGIDLIGGSVTNSGTIAGGYGSRGGTSGDGADIASGTMTNNGLVQGGNYAFAAGSGLGGTGASLTGGVLINNGQITGGDGGGRYGVAGLTSYGGSGVFLTGGVAYNIGSITGGTGTSGGGAGVTVAGGSLRNTGTITGGASVGVGGAGADITGGALYNEGNITGGAGSSAGGAGVTLQSGTLTNLGIITGAGVGVALLGGTLINANIIAGGGGQDAVLFGTEAATLVLENGGGFTGTVAANAGVNDSLVLAGTMGATLSGLGSAFTGFTTLAENAGASWTIAGQNRFGGTASIAGALTIAGTLTTGGTWTAADTILVAGSLANNGLIRGTNGANPLLVGPGGTLTNTGMIEGGGGVYVNDSTPGQAGGAGLTQSGGIVLNAGIIAGGAGANLPPEMGAQNGGGGGAGAIVGNGTFTNQGQVSGGAGGSGYVAGTGGIGLYLTGDGTTGTNAGSIAGGNGGDGYFDGAAAGIGVSLAGGSFTNTGFIGGGRGGASFYGAAGAVGVSIDGGTFSNTGTIQGGGGGNGYYYNNFTPGRPGAGGAGVYLNGGTLITSGFIGGGGGGTENLPDGSTAQGAAGAAVSFGRQAATLLIDPGATFGGLVQANGVNDVLALGGTRSATLSGLGTAFTGFTSLLEETGAIWTLAGSSSFNGAVSIGGTLTDAGTLALTGTVSGTGTLAVAASATLSASGSLAVAVSDAGLINVSSGTLAVAGKVSGAGKFVVAASAVLDLAGGGTLAQAVGGLGTLALGNAFALGGHTLTVSNVAVAQGAMLTGNGALSGKLFDSGLVEASGGTLLLSGGVTGSGTLMAAAGATVNIAKSSTIGGTLTGPGTIALTSASTLQVGAVLSAGTFLLEASLGVASGENLAPGKDNFELRTSSAGQSLTVAGVSNLAFTNSGTLSAGGPGTCRLQAALTNTALVESLSGTFALVGGSTNNSGTISALGGTLMIRTDVQGTGKLDIGTISTLWLEAGAVASQTASFTAAGGTLELGGPASFLGHIAGFGASDVIELAAAAATTLSYAGGVLTVDDGSTAVAQLHFNGSYTSASFSLSADGHGNSLITFV